MNLEGKKSVTRNGVEYPVMWVWNNPHVKELAIVLEEFADLSCDIVSGISHEAFLLNERQRGFDVIWREHCEPQKEPTLRPYAGEQLTGIGAKWIVSKKGTWHSPIEAINKAENKVRWRGTTFTTEELLEGFTFSDGSPCGVEE